MGLKESFIRFCELQRAADEMLRFNPNSRVVVEAFEDANTLKRKIVNELEKIDEISNN